MTIAGFLQSQIQFQKNSAIGFVCLGVLVWYGFGWDFLFLAGESEDKSKQSLIQQWSLNPIYYTS